MSINSRFGILVTCLVACCLPALTDDLPNPILAKATQLFGNPGSLEQRAFALNDVYVVWLISDAQGNLVEVVVGPKSYYASVFPDARKSTLPESLTEQDYKAALSKISELRKIGKLQKEHGAAVWSSFGALNTDRFEYAFVERIVGASPADLQDPVQNVRRFSVYFLEEMAGSPKQVLTMQGQPMVCLGNSWYYLREDAGRIRLGRWQTMHVAGPNQHGTTDCLRTTVLYDADGFTIEEPQNETIVVAEPYRVRALAGQVRIGDSPLEGANVEVKRLGHKKVFRTKTSADGGFGFSGTSAGEYKFKVTKDGFKALSGTIVVDRNALKERISFEVYLGT